MTNPSAYERLVARFGLVATTGECASMLGWDAAAVMPAGGGNARSDQLSVLAVLQHQHLTAPETEADLLTAETFDPWQAANLRLMRHAYIRAKALPADLIGARAKANSDCEKVWRIARHSADFRMVQPHLASVLKLTCEAAAALGDALGLSPIRCAYGRLPARNWCRRRRAGVRFRRKISLHNIAGSRTISIPATGAISASWAISRLGPRDILS